MVCGRHLSLVETLTARFHLEAAAFEQGDVESQRGKPPGQDQPGYARANNAERGPDGRARIEFIEIDMHATVCEAVPMRARALRRGGRAGFDALRQNLLHHNGTFFGPGQLLIQSLVLEREPGIFNAELVKNGRVQVADVHRVFDNVVRKIIRFTAH